MGGAETPQMPLEIAISERSERDSASTMGTR